MKGLYLYCISKQANEFSLGNIGIEAQEVYSLAFHDLSVIVQAFDGQNYEKQDSEVLARCVQIYHEVVSRSWEKLGVVLPVKFGTVIKAKDGKSPKALLFSWLEQEREKFQLKLIHLSDKAEYGVSFFWDKNKMRQKICQENPEISQLSRELETKSQGLAYLLKHKLEIKLKKAMEKLAQGAFTQLYDALAAQTFALKVEELKKNDNGKLPLLNLSCLINAREEKNFQKILTEIENQTDFEAQLIGPFPPYSFV